MEMQIKVATSFRNFVFSCVEHLATKQEEHLIEPEFYEKGNPSVGVPKGGHYELELVSTPWFGEDSPPLHIHESKRNGRKFVCWPMPVPTQEAAREIFSVWCVGTAYTLIYRDDFVRFYISHGKKFLEVMGRAWGIKIEE